MRLIIIGLLLTILTSGGAIAEDQNRTALSGAYILTQETEKGRFQRILTLDPDGFANQSSDQQGTFGFTVGLGMWRPTGSDSVFVRIVDFAFDPKTNERLGVTVLQYNLTRDDPVAGAPQAIAGTVNVKVYAPGEDPLQPIKPPHEDFDVELKGHRFTAD